MYPFIAVIAMIGYRPEDSLGTISATYTTRMLRTTMERHFSMRKAQRGKKITRMFDSDQQHGIRLEKDWWKRKELQVNTNGLSFWKH